MGTLTVLQLANEALVELSINGLDGLSTLVGNSSDSAAAKVLRNLHRTCRLLAGRHDWSVLRKEKTFSTTAAAAQTGAIPDDFLRFIEGSQSAPCAWNRTTNRPLLGPLTPGEWQSFQAQTNQGISDMFYLRGTTFLITPTPAASQTIAYEYIKNTIGLATDGSTERTSFTVDTDTTFFDDELVILGMVWRYRKAEGQDYSEEYRDFELRLYDLIKMDGHRRILDMTGAPSAKLPLRPAQDYTVTPLP